MTESSKLPRRGTSERLPRRSTAKPWKIEPHEGRPRYRLPIEGTEGGRQSGKAEAVVRQEDGVWCVYLGTERVFRSSGDAGLDRAKAWTERFAARGWAGMEVVR